MQTDNISVLNSFGSSNIPDLDVAVLGALELLQQKELPKIDVSAYKRPLVVGSGNAEVTGRIMFEKSDAIFASESNFEEKLKNIPAIDGVVLISASGEKHAPVIARVARDMGKPVALITNSANSTASRELSGTEGFREYVYPKNREPYTYNTSTYMGMILGATGEDPTQIERYIRETIDNLEFPDFSKYDKYYLSVPANLSGIIRMLELKFIELFGRNIARDIETSEYMQRHATTVVPSDELFISFGELNNDWGLPENRLFVPLPEGCGYGAMMAIGYYVVARIQKAYPNYFKNNIVAYTEKVSQLTGQTIRPIVE
jgi:hypothetical protein